MKLPPWLARAIRNTETRDNSPTQGLNNIPISQAANWLSFGNGGSDSGEAVNSNTAMQTATFNACVRLISSSIASMNPILYQRSGKGKQEAFSNSLHDLLCMEPNPDSTAFTLWDSFVASILLHGNGYIELTRNAQKTVTGLWFLHPATVQVFRQPDGSIAYKTNEGLAPGTYRTLQAGDVIHVPWLSLNGITGISVLDQCRNVVGGMIAMDKYGGRFFANDATPRAVLTSDGKVKPEDKMKMRSDWEELHSRSNQHRIAVLDSGIDIKTLSITNADAEFLASKNYSRQEICGLFGLHASQIGSEARVAGETYAAQQLAFLTDCLRPWLNKIEQELTRKLLPKSQNPGGIYSIAHDVSDRLKMDVKSQMEAFAVARQWGIMTANQARAELNLNPGGPECDVYLSPLNMVDATKLLLPEQAPTQVVLNE